MEKPSPHLSNEIKALSQIVVLKRDVWEGLSRALSRPASEGEGECSLFMIDHNSCLEDYKPRVEVFWRNERK